MISLAEPVLPRNWVTDQYDRYVRGNTVLAQPADAGIVRVGESTVPIQGDAAPERGLAMATDCNGRYTMLDPYAGGQLALAEAYRNVVTTGAAPLAVTDCLNFGNPEDPSRHVAAAGGHPRHRRRLRTARNPGHRR